MRKSLLFALFVATILVTTPAFAFMDAIYDDSNTNQQGQQQGIAGSGNSSSTAVAGNNGQQQGQIGINKNTNDLSNRNSNLNSNIGKNEQDQGQLQGQAQGQGQMAVGQVKVQDNSSYESKAFAFAPPAIYAQKGTSTANMYSIFGGIGLSQTEEYTIAIEKIAVIERMQQLGYLTPEEARQEARETFIELDSASQPKRVLGIFGKTRGRHLLNGLGLLAWDSFYVEGQKPFSSKIVIEPVTVDTLDTYVGNEGNLQ